MENKETSFQEIREILEKLALSQAEREANSEKEMKAIRKAQIEREANSEKEMKAIRKTQAKIDKILEKIAVTQAEASQQIKEISKSFHGFTDNQGSMIENLFFESLKGDMFLDDISYYDITLNLEIENKKINLNQEFDIILKNGSDIAIIETKSKPKLNDLEQLQNIIKNYKNLFKEHKNYKIKGFLASLYKFDPHFKKQAQKKGLKLLNLKGDKVQVL